MILNRLKDIIRASINEQIDRIRERDTDFDYEAWQQYDKEYERIRKEQASYQPPHGNGSAKSNQEMKYYQILEVSPTASFEEIKKSYRRLMKMYHPDMFRNDEEKHQTALEISRQLNEAYVYFERKFGK